VLCLSSSLLDRLQNYTGIQGRALGLLKSDCYSLVYLNWELSKLTL